MQGKSKQQWRKRNNPNAPNYGQAFVLEPRGDKRNLQKGGLTVITPAIARKLHLAKVNVAALPKTMYHDKKDKMQVKYFEDLIQRGIVPPPAEIHMRPDGTWEILDGKHRIEAYRNLGYKRIPVVTNATVGEIASAIGSDYETELMEQPRSFAERKVLAMKAIQAQRGNPLSGENTGAAYDVLNPLSAGETQVEDVLDMKKRQVVRSGDIVTKGGRRGETWKTRVTGSDAQLGTHYMEEPHGDKSALPRELQIVVPPMRESPSVPVEAKQTEAVESANAEDVKDKLEELKKRLEASEDKLKDSESKLKEAEEAAKETPAEKADREYREKALIIAQDRSAKMRARKEKARLKEEAEKEKDRLFPKAGKKGAKAATELADRVFTKTEEQTLEDAKNHGAEAQLIKRQTSWRKKSIR